MAKQTAFDTVTASRHVIHRSRAGEHAHAIIAADELGPAIPKPKTIPTVGMLATMHYLSDLVPYEVIEVRSAKTIVVREMSARRTDSNGFGGHQEYEYSSNPNGETVVMTLRDNGRWIQKGTGMRSAGRGLTLGEARRYDDPHF